MLCTKRKAFLNSKKALPSIFVLLRVFVPSWFKSKILFFLNHEVTKTRSSTKNYLYTKG